MTETEDSLSEVGGDDFCGMYEAEDNRKLVNCEISSSISPTKYTSQEKE